MGGVLFTGTPVLRTYALRAYVRDIGVPVNKTPPPSPLEYMFCHSITVLRVYALNCM